MSERKFLIPYFSHTGETEKVAKRIRDLTGGRLFKIDTVKNYSDSFPICALQAAKEKYDNARPELRNDIANIDEYTDIIIGYPAWAFSCPKAVLTFVESYDLNDKNVYLFNTSKGSGSTGTLEIEASIGKKLPKSLDVRDISDEEIKEWLSLED